MMKHYDKDGSLLTLMEWAKKLEDSGYKIVEQTTLSNEKWVSTVWLGLDHSFEDSEKPLIFETMVFPKKDDMSELECQRYSTLDEAKKGHAEMVKKYS